MQHQQPSSDSNQQKPPENVYLQAQQQHHAFWTQQQQQHIGRKDATSMRRFVETNKNSPSYTTTTSYVDGPGPTTTTTVPANLNACRNGRTSTGDGRPKTRDANPHVMPASYAYAPTSSTSAISSSRSSTLQHIPVEKRLQPPALPPQMISNIDGHSVETLCTLGRELVMELMTRMFNTINTLKTDIKGDNKNKEDLDVVRNQLDYSRLIFLVLTEIRLRIDLKLQERLADGQSLMDARPSDQQLLQLLSDPTPVEQNARKAELEAKFERNREALVRMSCRLKKLEWACINSAPSALMKQQKREHGGGGGRK